MTTNPNRIKLPTLSCVRCGKCYRQKYNLERHVVACDLMYHLKTKQEDSEEIPPPKKLYSMFLELGHRYCALEKKVHEMSQSLSSSGNVKKKRKVDILEHLNNHHPPPSTTFESLLDIIEVKVDDVLAIIEPCNSFYDVANTVLSRSLYSLEDTPLRMYNQKTHTLYGYVGNVWVELSQAEMRKFFIRLHSKMYKAFFEWKMGNSATIKADDRMCYKVDSAFAKIMGVEFANDHPFQRMKSLVYTNMKKYEIDS